MYFTRVTKAWVVSEFYYSTSCASNSRDFDTSLEIFFISEMHCGIMFATGVM